MKRALVVLLALVMGAGLLFAADQAPPKWGAYVEGWLTFWNQDGQAFLGPSWDGDLATGQYTTLTLSYAEANVGFSFTSEFDSDNIFGGVDPTVNPNSLRNMSGWYSLFESKLKFTAGKVRDASYRPTTYIEGAAAYSRQANAEWGLLTQVMPVKGLSVGAFVEFPEAAAAQDYANNLAFGASYAVDGIGTFYLQYRLNGDDQLGVAAKVTALKALPLFVAYGFNNVMAVTPVSTVLFSTQYVMDALTVSLDVKAVFPGAADDFDYAAHVSAAYKLNPSYTVGLNAGYGDIAYATGGSLGGLFVYPWASIAVGSASSMKLGFILDTDGDGAGADVLKWSLPLRYIISF